MSFHSKALREQRAAIAEQMNKNLVKEQNSEVRAEFRKLDEKQAELLRQIQEIENTEMRNAKVQEIAERELRAGLENEPQREYRKCFGAYLRRGMGGLNEEGRSIMAREFRTDDKTASQWGNVTGQSYTGGDLNGGSTSGVAGGYLVPAGFQFEVDSATKYVAPLLDGSIVRTIETAGGGLLPFPTENDTSAQAVILADATQETELGVSFGVVNFGAYKYSSRIVRVSVELLQDAAFNMEGLLAEAFGKRFGRKLESDLTVGSGVASPKGLITAVLASGASPVVAAGSNANDGLGFPAYSTIGSNDLIALEHSVDPTYRRGAKFMLHDTSLKVIKSLLDKYGRPIWLPGLAVNAPDTILGYPYVINQSMQTPVANTNPTTVAFGDMQKYIVRKVKDMSVLRLNERYADFGQVGFIAFMRIDGNLVDAGTHPINVLQQHS
jgi:HK97 family phage major capsid protein